MRFIWTLIVLAWWLFFASYMFALALSEQSEWWTTFYIAVGIIDLYNLVHSYKSMVLKQ